VLGGYGDKSIATSAEPDHRAVARTSSGVMFADGGLGHALGVVMGGLGTWAQRAGSEFTP